MKRMNVVWSGRSFDPKIQSIMSALVPKRTHSKIPGLVLYAVLGVSLTAKIWSAPTVQEISVVPNPLYTGQSFTINVIASPDVTEGSASVDFRPSWPGSLPVILTKQGQVWTGSAVVPGALQTSPASSASIRVLMFDAARHRAQGNLTVSVLPSPITAVWASGVLTVTGDFHDNTIVVGRDAAGTILVNGGLVIISGGPATVGNTTEIKILGLGGNDELRLNETNGVLPKGNLSGGDGNDYLVGGHEDDVLDGGPGDDTLVGRRGNDAVFGGDGSDFFTWDPGDGSDILEGQGGNDTLAFNGANIGEEIDLSANGSRFRFSRNIGTVLLDCDGVENVEFRAVGGADMVVVNDLQGTQVTEVRIDLSGTTAGAGDGQADTVVIYGTAGNDSITVAPGAAVGELEVTGLSANVLVAGGEADQDELILNALAGDDHVDASGVPAGEMNLTLNGGPGADQLLGSEGNDLIIGGQGDDIVFCGAGDDTFNWNPGDGSDTIEGQGGFDALVFEGANINEQINLSANGLRLRFSRDIGSVTLDCDGLELVQFRARGGADDITIDDLGGTALTHVELDLAAVSDSGIGDAQADLVRVTGTTGDDTISIAGDAGGVSLLGLAATIDILGTDPALDQLIVNSLAGDDVIDGTGLQAGALLLTEDGGDDDDVLLGSAGNDVLLGGNGDDVLLGGPGLDTLDGGPGTNILIQD